MVQHAYSKLSSKTLRVGSAIEMGCWKVVYNNEDKTVTIEGYIDKTTDGTKPGTFTKVFSFTDSKGKMENFTSDCVEENCQLPVTYGGPIVKIDGISWIQCNSSGYQYENANHLHHTGGCIDYLKRIDA
jgi:hypothetical protein